MLADFGGTADLAFPRAICAGLVAAGRAAPHAAGFPGVVSLHLRTADDLPALIALFRRNDDRALAAAARRTPAPVP